LRVFVHTGKSLATHLYDGIVMVRSRVVGLVVGWSGYVPTEFPNSRGPSIRDQREPARWSNYVSTADVQQVVEVYRHFTVSLCRFVNCPSNSSDC
jgi:hypothetical protein